MSPPLATNCASRPSTAAKSKPCASARAARLACTRARFNLRFSPGASRPPLPPRTPDLHVFLAFVLSWRPKSSGEARAHHSKLSPMQPLQEVHGALRQRYAVSNCAASKHCRHHNILRSLSEIHHAVRPHCVGALAHLSRRRWSQSKFYELGSEYRVSSVML